MSCDRLHASTDCMRASMKSRISRIRFCTSGVRRGILPSAGSTMSDVRGPIGLLVSTTSASNVTSYAPVRSSSVPRAATRSPRLGALAACCARSASRWATSASVSRSLPASRAARWSGTWYFCAQRPWRSGSPHAVFGACAAWAETGGGARSMNATAAMTDVATASDARNCLYMSALPQNSVRKPNLNVRPGRMLDAFSQLPP